MRRFASAVAATGLAVTMAMASATLIASPASAEPTSAQDCAYVWVYSGTYYSGSQNNLNCTDNYVKGFGFNVRSVINHNAAGNYACGIDAAEQFWRFQSYYQWPDVGGQTPLGSFAWPNTWWVDPFGVAWVVNC